MIKIIKNLCNKYYTVNNIDTIVIHYTASPDGTAKSVCNYFKTSDKASSAHYIVDETSIYQSVEEKYGAYHAGNKKINQRSIGIEICCHKTNKSHIVSTDKDWFFSDITLNNVLDLISDIKKRYDIKYVIRHYDVTKKVCPAPFVNEPAKWNEFLSHINNNTRYGNSIINNNKINSNTSSCIFTCKINASSLNIRTGPSVSYPICGIVKKNEVYTIIQTSGNWGRLKSKAGWINLKYVERR